MNKIIVITGPQASGKSTKAKEIVAGMNAIWTFLHETQQENQFCEINQFTEVMVMEGVEFPKHTQRIIEIITTEKVFVPRRYKPSLFVRRPELIITTQSPKQDLPELLKNTSETRIIELPIPG